jgi:hypothetical protein
MTTPKVGHIFRLAQIIQESCEHCTDQEATSLAKAILEHPGSRWCPQQTPVPVPDKQIRPDEGKSVVYHKIRYMTSMTNPCESVRMAVIQALSEAWEGYASPKKITENGRVVWDSDSQDLDDFAESIGINPDDF